MGKTLEPGVLSQLSSRHHCRNSECLTHHVTLVGGVAGILQGILKGPLCKKGCVMYGNIKCSLQLRQELQLINIVETDVMSGDQLRSRLIVTEHWWMCMKQGKCR